MKAIIPTLLLAMLLFTCNKKDDDQPPTSPIDQLPPATQTGAQTFACLINGEVFIPPRFGSNAPRAFYQFVDGAYTLGISAGTGGGLELKSLNIGCLDKPLLEETNYTLLEKITNNYFGQYTIYGGIILNSTTSVQFPGILTITNFDQDNFVISGTFEFSVLDDDGNIINITDGRFDMNYTN